MPIDLNRVYRIEHEINDDTDSSTDEEGVVAVISKVNPPSSIEAPRGVNLGGAVVALCVKIAPICCV